MTIFNLHSRVMPDHVRCCYRLTERSAADRTLESTWYLFAAAGPCVDEIGHFSRACLRDLAGIICGK